MKITVPILQQLNKDYNEGATVSELSVKYDVTKNTINNYIWVKRAYRKLTDKQIKEMNKLYNKGATMKDLGVKYNVSYVTIHNYITSPREIKGSRKDIKNVTMEIVKEINRLYNKGYSMSAVGKLLKISSSTVCKYVWKPRVQGLVMEIMV